MRVGSVEVVHQRSGGDNVFDGFPGSVRVSQPLDEVLKSLLAAIMVGFDDALNFPFFNIVDNNWGRGSVRLARYWVAGGRAK